MTAMTLSGSDLISRIGISRSPLAFAQALSGDSKAASTSSELPTRVTLGTRVERDTVYSDPRSKLDNLHVWASPGKKDDAISGLMARNRNAMSYQLRDQWRGLGGALLKQFGQTGENYTQTLIDDPALTYGLPLEELAPEFRDSRKAYLLEMQATNLAQVANNAPTANVQIQTQSGQSVELKISVNPGLNGIVGMKVELNASGSMSADERTAIEQLAGGLDRVLEGIGRDDAASLDLSGLTGYDRHFISGIDLKVDSVSQHSVMNTFALHLGEGEQSVKLNGSDGELALDVDTVSPIGNASTAQQQASIQRTLDRIDRAGKSAQANVALIEQMKSAFTAFHTKADGEDDGRSGTTDATKSTNKAYVKMHVDAPKASSTPQASPPGSKEIAAELSGLADFEASFGGNTHRSNRFGSDRQAGQVHYQLSQKTSSTISGNGATTSKQTVSENLSAKFYTTVNPDETLNVLNGRYTTTRIQDSSTVATLIESVGDRISRVLRKTDEDLLKTVTEAKSLGGSHQHSWPMQRTLMERLR